jgi:hypothetical protein
MDASDIARGNNWRQPLREPMTPKRVLIITGVIFAALFAGLLLYDRLVWHPEEMKLRARYDQMRTALRTGDTNAARALMAPACRARADDHFTRLAVFARELGGKSKVRISDSRAVVCPETALPFGLFGHTIDLIKVNGEWYFTGGIGIF